MPQTARLDCCSPSHYSCQAPAVQCDPLPSSLPSAERETELFCLRISFTKIVFKSSRLKDFFLILLVRATVIILIDCRVFLKWD